MLRNSGFIIKKYDAVSSGISLITLSVPKALIVSVVELLGSFLTVGLHVHHADVCCYNTSTCY